MGKIFCGHEWLIFIWGSQFYDIWSLSEASNPWSIMLLLKSCIFYASEKPEVMLVYSCPKLVKPSILCIFGCPRGHVPQPWPWGITIRPPEEQRAPLLLARFHTVCQVIVAQNLPNSPSFTLLGLFYVQWGKSFLAMILWAPISPPKAQKHPPTWPLSSCNVLRS